MAKANAVAEVGQWSADESPVVVEYSHPVLEQIRAAAVAGYCRFPRGGMEVGGILFGNAEGNRVRILAAREVECEHASGPSYVLSAKDHYRLQGVIDASRRDPELAGMTPVGWYHSHTRSEVFLSRADLEIQDRYFPGRRQIALVLRPNSLGSACAGFFVREADGSIRSERSYQEFVILPPSRVRGAMVAAVDTAEPTATAPPKAASEELEPAETALEEFEPEEFEPEALEPTETTTDEFLEEVPPRRSLLPWVWMALAIAVAAAAFGLGPRLRPTAPALRPLGLRVLDTNGQLQIVWDRASVRDQPARSATLEFVDGGERVIVPFDAGRLMEGAFTYTRRSDNVEVRLRVARPGGAQEESVRFLGAAPAPAQSPVSIEPSALPLPDLTPEPQQPEPQPPAPETAAPKRPPRNFDLAWLPKAKPSENEAALPAPPTVESAANRPIPLTGSAPALSSSALTAPPPAPAPAPAPAAALKPMYAGPTSGRILWTGDFRHGVTNTLDGHVASAGAAIGELPGVPVRIRVHPAELAGHGLTVFSTGGSTRREPPGAGNGWNPTTYVADPRRAAEVLVLESPSPQNGWKKLALRNDNRDLSVIIIDWNLVE